LCVEEDLQRRSFSWFRLRREHHVLGFDWRPTHGTVRHEVEAPIPFSRLPHHWMTNGLTHPIEGVHAALPGDDQVI